MPDPTRIPLTVLSVEPTAKCCHRSQVALGTKQKLFFISSFSPVGWEVVNLDLPANQRYNDLVSKKTKQVR